MCKNKYSYYSEIIKLKKHEKIIFDGKNIGEILNYLRNGDFNNRDITIDKINKN